MCYKAHLLSYVQTGEVTLEMETHGSATMDDVWIFEQRLRLW